MMGWIIWIKQISLLERDFLLGQWQWDIYLLTSVFQQRFLITVLFFLLAKESLLFKSSRTPSQTVYKLKVNSFIHVTSSGGSWHLYSFWQLPLITLFVLTRLLNGLQSKGEGQDSEIFTDNIQEHHFILSLVTYLRDAIFIYRQESSMHSLTKNDSWTVKWQYFIVLKQSWKEPGWLIAHWQPLASQRKLKWRAVSSYFTKSMVCTEFNHGWMAQN